MVVGVDIARETITDRAPTPFLRRNGDAAHERFVAASCGADGAAPMPDVRRARLYKQASKHCLKPRIASLLRAERYQRTRRPRIMTKLSRTRSRARQQQDRENPLIAWRFLLSPA